MMKLKLSVYLMGFSVLLGSCGEKTRTEESKTKILQENSPKLGTYSNFKGIDVQDAWNVRYSNSLNGDGRILAYAEYGYDYGAVAFDDFSTPDNTLDGIFIFPFNKIGLTEVHHDWQNNSPFNSAGIDHSFVATYNKKINILPNTRKVIRMWGGADDGIKVSIVKDGSGEVLMNAWDHGEPFVSNFWLDHDYVTTPEVTYTFPESNHHQIYVIVVNYYENSGLARFDFGFDISDEGYIPPPPPIESHILDRYPDCGDNMAPHSANSAGREPSSKFNIYVGQCNIMAFEIWEVVQKYGTACKAKYTPSTFISGVHTRVDGIPNYEENNSFFIVKSSNNSKTYRIDTKSGDQDALICP